MSEQQWVGSGATLRIFNPPRNALKDLLYGERYPLGRIAHQDDVCQKSLDVYVRPLSQLFQVTNNELGITQLVQTLVKIQPELIVLEATGGMEIDAAVKLTEAGLAVAVINPRQASPSSQRFCQGNRAISTRLMPLMLKY